MDEETKYEMKKKINSIVIMKTCGLGLIIFSASTIDNILNIINPKSNAIPLIPTEF